MALGMEKFAFKEDERSSDEEISEEAHKKLIADVFQLYDKKSVDVIKQHETIHKISKLNLPVILDEECDEQMMDINEKELNKHELSKSLKECASHRYIMKKIKLGQKTHKKIARHLEKSQEQEVMRRVGYDNIKNQLNKWSAVVERNKLAPQIKFPIEQKNIKHRPEYNFLTTFKEPTELEKEMAKVLNQSKIAQEEREEENELSKLSVEQMIERRNMAAKMRARESYRISKAIRQNKIKSKKYRRILKKEKIRKELKDFEKLKETDPEAALEKLEQIERARAEERISLRHKNTGKWARSKAIRAKYDTDARIELAEQLAKSRELTKKLKSTENSSSESEDEQSENESNTNVNSENVSTNPWFSDFKAYITGYEKFSAERNNQGEKSCKADTVPEKALSKSTSSTVPGEALSKSTSSTVPGEALSKSTSSTVPGEALSKSTSSTVPGEALSKSTSSTVPGEALSKSTSSTVPGEALSKSTSSTVPGEALSKSTSSTVPGEALSKSTSSTVPGEALSKSTSSTVPGEALSKSTSSTVPLPENISENSNGSVSDEKTSLLVDAYISSDEDNLNNSESTHKQKSIDKIFEEAEIILDNKIKTSVDKIKKNKKLDVDNNKDDQLDKNSCKRFEFKNKTKLHDIDAALIEVADDGISSGINDISVLKDKLKVTENTKEDEPQINPNKHIKLKSQKLVSELPDYNENGDDSEEEEEAKKHLNLIEAFAEDDIVDQFRQEKNEEKNASKAKKIDLSMPGWGSWGGSGVVTKYRRKKRRFMIKLPKLPRKDKKKPNVIINEDPVPKLREQLVSELPYPFSSVKDFEASIRAPIGKHWVTEKAFKQLTAPPIVTKMGTIIEPLSSSMLVEAPKKRVNNNDSKLNAKKKKKIAK